MSTVDKFRLHRVHAAPAQGKGGCSFDVGGVRWRGEGRAFEERRAQAFRLALAWNLLEGVPTHAAAAGAIADFYAAVDELLTALRDDPTYAVAAGRVRAALAAHDVDLSNGRLHDCEHCIARDAIGADCDVDEVDLDEFVGEPEREGNGNNRVRHVEAAPKNGQQRLF